MADNRKLSALPAAPVLGADDLMYVVRQGQSSRASLGQFVTFAAATMQPAAGNLTALSGLEALPGRLPYFTGTGAMATTPTSVFGRGLLNLADAAAGRTALAAAAQTDADALASAVALKADKTVTITGAGLVTGGGALSANRTLTVTEASDAEALAGTAGDKAMTPRRTKAVVDAAVEVLEDAVSTLAAGQGSSTVAAATWSDLAGYPTGGRGIGDYAKVVGTDSGSHTDPVIGGTVDNRGLYVWSASPAGWRRIGDLDADDAAASAAAANAAVEAVLPATSYDNAGGMGDRTTSITVTIAPGVINDVFGEAPSNLINGVIANGAANSVSFTNGPAAGAYIRFDFGPGTALRITEARWIQGNADGHGIWRWRGSDNLVDYDDIGSSFTLGGATTQLQTELANNTQGYRYYELVGLSGSRSINPYIQEIEFQIARTSFDQRLLVSSHGSAGQVLTKLSDSSGDYTFQAARRIHPMPTAGLLAEWYFDEGEGDRARNVRSGDGACDVVFDSVFQAAYDSSPEWTRKGILLQKDVVQTATAIAGVRTVATLYRIKAGDEGIVLSGGASSGHGVLGQAVSKTYSHWVANGSGIAPLLYDPSNGSAAYRLNRGGWLLIFTEFDEAYDTKLGWGGIHSDAVQLNYRAAEMELAWSACWSGQLDDDSREVVFRGARRIAAERDIYIHWRDCPDFIDCVLFWGQSGITGYSVISGYSASGDLAAADQARTQPTDSVLISHSVGSGGEWLMPERFQFKYNHRAQGLIESRMGPLPGAAWAHEDNHIARRRTLFINQSAQDSTSLAVAGAAGPYEPSRTWNVAYLLTGNGMLPGAMRHWWELEQYFLLKGVGPRMRALWWFQGEEDSIDTVQSACYGDNIANMWVATKLYLATPGDFTMKKVKTMLLTPLAGFSVEANAQVRAQEVAFATANADVELIDGDDLEQQNAGWPNDEHWTAQGVKTIGVRLYAATALG